MTQRYVNGLVGVLDGTRNPADLADPKFFGARIHTIIARYLTVGDAIGDTIVIGKLPKGAVPIIESENTDTTLGTSTLAIGSTTSAAKYRAAHTLTGVDTPSGGMKAAAQGVELAAAETLIATVAVAALPVGANVIFEFRFTLPEGG